MTAQELQIQLQGFVDVASELLQQAGDGVARHTDDPRVRLRARQLTVYPRLSLMQLVTGPNPDATLLDMLVVSTLFRIVVEDYWVPQVFGDLGGPVRDAAWRIELYIWEIGDDVLSPMALGELRSLIGEWRERYPDQRFVSRVRFREFALLRDEETGGTISGIFNTVNPLSGLRRTNQEIQETRLLAERAMFMVQRMPDLMLSQAQVSLVETLNMPETQQMLGHVDTLAGSAQRLTLTAEALPDQLGVALETHSETTRQLLAETRETLELAQGLSESVGRTVETADQLVARVVPEPGAAGAAAGSEPVDVEAALTEANELVGSLERLVASPAWDARFPQIESTIDRMDRSGVDLIDLAFQRAAMLVGVILAAALIYRFASRRMG